MFNFLDELSETYTWPVILKLPASGGKVKEVTFYAEFRRLSEEREQEISDETNARIKKIISRAKQELEEGFAAEDDDAMAQVNESLRDEVLESVGEMDKSGSYTAADSAEAGRLLALRGATHAILVAYGKSKSGEKAKN